MSSYLLFRVALDISTKTPNLLLEPPSHPPNRRQRPGTKGKVLATGHWTSLAGIQHTSPAAATWSMGGCCYMTRHPCYEMSFSKNTSSVETKRLFEWVIFEFGDDFC